MSQDAHQRQAFEFLRQRCITQEPFTLAQFREATGFTQSSFKTYLSKQFKPFLKASAEDKFRVSLAFRQYTWPRFRDEIATQNRRFVRKYRSICHKYVVLFEFFMPLRNEEWLRAALDALFFKDAIIPRLKAIGLNQLELHFAKEAGETDEQYLERVCDWISHLFRGYSINHVSGRFKVESIKTRREIAEAEALESNRYVVDETTAVVRFIFPCGKGPDVQDAERTADQIRWFFEKLFVDTILEVVNGEDEIWLLESGMHHNLHIFEAED